MNSARSLALGAALFLSACADTGGEDPPPPDPSPYTISLLGDVKQDTIGTEVSPALVVRVEQDGLAAENVDVRFAAVGCQQSGCPGISINGGPYESVVTQRTDERGRASVRVRLGTRAGEAFVEAKVAGTTVADTALYHVLPGVADSLAVYATVDTLLLVGGSYDLTASLTDRAGNPVDLPVNIYFGDSEVVQMTGTRVTAVGPGVSWVSVLANLPSGHGLGRQGQISVVPPGRLVLGGGGVEIANTDGSRLRGLGESGSVGGTWSPDGQRVAYQGYASNTLQQMALGGPPTVLVGAVDPVRTPSTPVYTRDNAWVYFSAFGTDVAVPYWEVWRVRPSGTALERISAPSSENEGDFAPSPSPDGTRVVWSTTRGSPGAPRLVIRNLLSGTTTELGVAGTLPAWSPDGNTIAFLSADNTIHVMPAVGGVATPVPGGHSTYLPMGWSPDGQWLVTSYNFADWSTVLLRVSDGRAIPLPWAKGRMGTSWAAGTLP